MRLVFLLFLSAALGAQPLRLEKTILLPGVKGRIDHLAIDVEGRRLFVAALGNDTVEVIDPIEGKPLRSIGGLHEPQGVYYWPAQNRLYVANGGNGKVDVFDAGSFQRIRQYDFNSDPDNIRFDPREKELFVGYGNGALGVINAPLGSRVGDVVLDAHPESFQLERQGPRIFVNIPGGISSVLKTGHVSVIDRRTRTVIAKWEIEGAKQNFPMAFDEVHQRLFIGCRRPAKMLILDTKTGKQIGAVDIAGDTDDLFYDADRKRIYVSGGAGSVTVLAQTDPDHYQVMANIPTAEGARTSLFVPEYRQLYVMAPRRGDKPARLLVFAVQDAP